ncbi:MAG: hypothetical protein LBO09_06970 [Candidatus Peribacteria bacterium]|nr:hypothetical protein [Candidatus Peribacteria bacterium]
MTLAIAIAINFTIGELFTSRSPLLSLLIGFVLYIIIGKVADLNGFYTIKKLFTVWLYYLLLALALAYGILYLYEKGDLVERYLPTLRGQENFFSNTTNQPENNDNPNINTEFTPATGDYVYEGSGEVISSTSGVNTTTETTTGTTITTGTVINTGAKTPTTGTSTNEVTPQSTPEKVKDITMIEAIKHVIDTNTLPLSKKTDISFTSMSKSNADYTYFRTAYETRMIGKNTDPSKQISCDTYMVIKGIGEGRNVGSYTDVKLAYWKKAEELGKLNGCKKGGWVTSATL